MSPTDPLDPTTPRRIGVVGLGSMGGAMAASLAGRGWDVVGWDPSAAAREAAEARGLATVAGVSALAGIPYVVLAAVRARGRGDGARAPRRARHRGRRRHHHLRARHERRDGRARRRARRRVRRRPGLRRQHGRGRGHARVLRRRIRAGRRRRPPRPRALTSGGWRHIGPAGSGNVVKLLNNMLVSVNLLAVAEAMDVAAAHGIDLDTAVAALNTATGASTVSQRMFPDQILNGRFGSGFALGLMARDVALAHDVARATGATPASSPRRTRAGSRRSPPSARARTSSPRPPPSPRRPPP